MSEEWTDWIEHDGKGCPVSLGTVVHRVFDKAPDIVDGKKTNPRSEYIGPVEPSELLSWGNDTWHPLGRIPLIIRYRIRLPRALSQLKAIAENPKQVEVV